MAKRTGMKKAITPAEQAAGFRVMPMKDDLGFRDNPFHTDKEIKKRRKKLGSRF